ncbi:MAG TPA: hypothetical protein VIH95_00090 [Acidimicrobiales bacterium]
MDADDLPAISYGTIDRDYARDLASVAPDDDGPIWMVNLMRYRDRAVYADGRDTDLTGREADDRYAPFGPFRTVGAELVFLSDVEVQLVGEDQEWDRIAVVRYPTRHSFLAMQELPEYVELHEHKDAGMASTFVIAGRPAPLPDLPVDAPPLDKVPHPSTPEDGPVVILHVLKYHEGRSSPEMDLYTSEAARVALPHGARICAWLDVEGTIVGDGRSWDQVRFNVFPSQEAFLAVAHDPARLSAQADHREPSIADTYTLMLRPVVDRLAESIRA